jgi:nucleotide-binding universal stress UspA family protein
LYVTDTTQLTAHPPAVCDDEYFDKVKSSFAGVASVTHTVESGNPAGIIVDIAAEHVDTLIAMAAHGHSGAPRWLLGSTTQKVLHAAKNDLLVVRPAEEQSEGEAAFRTLLVPLDGSQWAEKALPTVSGLATRFKSDVVLLHVLVRFSFPLPETVVPVIGMNIPHQKEFWDEARTEATKYLNDKVERLRADGLEHVSCVLIDGGAEGAAADIVDRAAKTPESVVVMTTHGRSGVGRWLLGSVVERVVRYSTGAVWVIRPQRQNPVPTASRA